MRTSVVVKIDKTLIDVTWLEKPGLDPCITKLNETEVGLICLLRYDLCLFIVMRSKFTFSFENLFIFWSLTRSLNHFSWALFTTSLIINDPSEVWSEKTHFERYFWTKLCFNQGFIIIFLRKNELSLTMHKTTSFTVSSRKTCSSDYHGKPMYSIITT